MMNLPFTELVAQRAETLRALHAGPRMLILPNVWDAASARLVEAAGFPAIATTSGGVAATLGYQDHENAPVEEMLAAAARIVAAVSVPVSVDFEAGYQLEPRELAERLIIIGAAGLNLEDSSYHAETKLVAAEQQAERLAAVKAAASAAGVDLVLNARVDVFIHRLGAPEQQIVEGLRRARLYRQAGADCVYPILLSDDAMIAAFVENVGIVNINLRRSGPISLQRCQELEVRRVSYATSIFRETLTAIERIVAEVKAGSTALDN